VYNDDLRVGRLIDSLLSQKFEKYEIIVVDDCSTDGTYNSLEEYAARGSIRLYRSPDNRGSGFARNLGARNARGEILAFTDSDCVADERWLEEVTRPIIAGEADATMGPNHLCLRQAKGCRLESIRAKQYWGMDTKNMAIRRGIFEDLGGFNEGIKVNVDAEFHRRFVAEGGSVLLTEAKVYHDFPEDAVSLIMKARKRGREEAKILVDRRGLLKATRLIGSRMVSKLRRLRKIWAEGRCAEEGLALVVYYVSFHLSWSLSLFIALTLGREAYQ
jgi:glycosyltransferase involved in cell wall biosynthesis